MFFQQVSHIVITYFDVLVTPQHVTSHEGEGCLAGGPVMSYLMGLNFEGPEVKRFAPWSVPEFTAELESSVCELWAHLFIPKQLDFPRPLPIAWLQGISATEASLGAATERLMVWKYWYLVPPFQVL